MLLRLPKNLHYPITITKILKRAGEAVAKNDHLFRYTYTDKVIEGSRDGEETEVEREVPTQFESSLDGTLTSWRVWEGDVLAAP